MKEISAQPRLARPSRHCSRRPRWRLPWPAAARERYPLARYTGWWCVPPIPLHDDALPVLKARAGDQPAAAANWRAAVRGSAGSRPEPVHDAEAAPASRPASNAAAANNAARDRPITTGGANGAAARSPAALGSPDEIADNDSRPNARSRADSNRSSGYFSRQWWMRRSSRLAEEVAAASSSRAALAEDGVEGFGRLSPERAPAGEHLVEDGAEREDVGSMVNGVPAHLLRGHVAHRPSMCAGSVPPDGPLVSSDRRSVVP